MSFNFLSPPVILILSIIIGWFAYQHIHKRRVENGADPTSQKASCLLSMILVGGVGGFLILIWINSNWTN